MKLEHTVSVDVERERVWTLLMDITATARFVPGVEAVALGPDDVYRGAMRVAVGPVRLSLEGEVRIVSRDDDAGIAMLRVDAADRRLDGRVRADVELRVEGSSPTVIRVASDINVLGRLGELGQPLIRRKADQVMGEFAQNLRRALA